MSRKNWSNFFILLAAVNLACGVIPGNPARIIDWMALPCCLMLGVLARRRMV